MHKALVFTLFCWMACMLTCIIVACPHCIGHLDREQQSPPFFSKEYDEYWHLADKSNAHLLTNASASTSPHASAEQEKKEQQ